MDDLIEHAAPGTPTEAAVAPAPLSLSFSGSGAEYFRIWIVNLLLSVATLGIYSAWAKTRRLQYFYRNTHLAGASFDFRGDPKAILRGRLLAVAVLGAYHYAFGLSRTTGLVIVAVLLLGLPFMMRSALRFRLSNTWYRGLPFGFSGSVKHAYLVYLLPIALVVVPSALAALTLAPGLLGAFFLLYLLWPLMHGAMRRYQHRHLVYGDQQASFPLSIFRLALPYLQGFLVSLAIMLILGIVLIILGAIVGVTSAGAGGKKGVDMGMAVVIIIGIVLFYLSLLMIGPFVAVRLNNRAWSATAFPGVRIDCHMAFWSYFRLQLVNVLLTLLTLGLFRPFAAVRTWRYRIEHLRIDAPEGFEQATHAARRRPAAAAGDGVADFIGVDLSW
ncbi:YjgN family protein [Massilia phyllosphaerae]|uniref:YjgN family protein n=1 Tax=Massilia phyllosphaerae TaxID=3106034 RepID=UPI002B1CAF15|nr:YjgN family protein [Massilia sp. SGZ-792]